MGRVSSRNVLYRARWAYRSCVEQLEEHRVARRRKKVEAILARPEPSSFYDSEEVFDRLQRRYPPRPEYGWTAYEAWSRGMQRAPGLIRGLGLTEPGARVLDAACGGGMTGAILASYGHHVTLHDLEDWRDARAKSLPFVAGDLGAALPLSPDQFDLIFSYNAFEHIGDPAAALRELVRLCRPGGLIHLDFGPLYHGPWGLHAWTALRMPYPQFLFSPEFRQRKIDEIGLLDLGRRTTTLQPLNQWTLGSFERLWRESGCEIEASAVIPDVEQLDVIARFPEAFTGTGLSFADVTAFQLSVTLRKPRSSER
jgi:SAM-dependent methyltransferase